MNDQATAMIASPARVGSEQAPFCAVRHEPDEPSHKTDEWAHTRESTRWEKNTIRISKSNAGGNLSGGRDRFFRSLILESDPGWGC
jgi:hypothetical protein